MNVLYYHSPSYKFHESIAEFCRTDDSAPTWLYYLFLIVKWGQAKAQWRQQWTLFVVDLLEARWFVEIRLISYDGSCTLTCCDQLNCDESQNSIGWKLTGLDAFSFLNYFQGFKRTSLNSKGNYATRCDSIKLNKVMLDFPVFDSTFDTDKIFLNFLAVNVAS